MTVLLCINVYFNVASGIVPLELGKLAKLSILILYINCLEGMHIKINVDWYWLAMQNIYYYRNGNVLNVIALILVAFR